MLYDKVHGLWDRVAGFGRELLGEMTGNNNRFRAGLRQRVLGRLETERDISRAEAEQELERIEKSD